MYGFGQAVQCLSEFFYADDGLIDSTKLVWIQAEWDVLKNFTGWSYRTTYTNKSGWFVIPATLSADTRGQLIHGG